MAFSVNTNNSALMALQNLKQTDKSLMATQNQLNTGMKVASSKDNAAVFSIAQRMRASVSGLSAVQSSLDRAISTLDVALAAGEAVSDLLIEMKEKAVSAKDAGLDTSSKLSLQDDFAQLRDQIDSIVNNAEFNGINAVGGASPVDITAIVDETGGSSISISAQNLTLAGSIIEIDATSSISSSSSAGTVVSELENSITNVNQALSKMGAGSNRLALQKEFSAKLQDSFEIGIGNLVDADMAKVSANLQSLQVKQQLGLQALSIANQAPAAINSLFQ